MDVTVTDGTLSITEDINMWLYGDVNYNGKINAGDTSQIQKRLAGLTSDIKDENTHQLIAADINGNGKINAGDVSQIQKKLAGLTSSFEDFTR